MATQAEELLWTARSVEQIQNDLTKTDNKTSYTVQYGDTLSTIAEALGVDVTVLANLNKITNMDLIFPETVLTTTVNEAEEVTEVEIQTPQADSSEEVTTATADLTTNQVTVDDQTVQVADLSQPIAEAPKAVETTSTKRSSNKFRSCRDSCYYRRSSTIYKYFNVRGANSRDKQCSCRGNSSGNNSS